MDKLQFLVLITFITKSIETCFINFNSPQDVICRLKGTESVRSRFQRFKDTQKLIMSNLLLYIRLLYSLSSDFALFGILWDQ